MTRLAIVLSDQLVQGDRRFRFEERRGELLDFREAGDGQRLTLTDEELAEMIADGRAILVRRQERESIRSDLVAKRTKDFSLQPPEVREKALERLAYVDAARSGPKRLMSEAQLGEVIAETAARRGDADPPCRRTVRRWLNQAGEARSASALVDAIALKGNRTDRLDLRVRELIERKIDEVYMQRPPVSLTTLLDEVRTAIEDLSITLPVVLACPHYNTVRRLVGLRSLRDVMAARYGEAAAAQKFDATVTRGGPTRPHEIIEYDTTPADLFVVCERTGLPIGRPTIGSGLDRASRYPWCLHISFDPPSVHTVMQGLRNGMLPKTYLDQKVRAGEWDIKNRWVACGKPITVLFDRALENIGHDLTDFAAVAGFHLKFAPRKTGKYKGAIERFLKTLNYQLLHEQRGTTFANVIDRDDYDPAKNAVITYDRLLEAVHKWLLDVYACSVHKGIRDIPIRLYEELVQRYPVQPIEDVQQLNMLFGRVQAATLQKTGIRFEHIIYFSPDLVAMLTDPRFHKLSPDRTVKFRYDAGDLSIARVYDPRHDQYMMVPACERDAAYVKGLSIWQHRIIVKHWNKRLKEIVDYGAISRAKVEIAEMFKAAWQPKSKVAARKTAARHDGIGRYSMAGSDEATSPVGSVDHAQRAAEAEADTPKPDLRIVQGSKPASASKQVSPTPLPSVEDPSSVVDLYAEIGVERRLYPNGE